MPTESTRFTQTCSALLFSLCSVAMICSSTANQSSIESSSETRAAGQQRILLFTKTAGFTHGSIPTATTAIRAAAEQAGLIVDDSDDATLFNETDLNNYDAVVFLMTTGNILNDTQQEAFETYIQNGNGYVGIHSAADTEYDWPWYGDLVGAYFSNHPSIQQATINIENAAHPSTENLTDPWVRTDEWYNFQTNPRDSVIVLATIDESTYSGGNMGDDHPIAWYHDFDGGRSWYTAGGHTNSSYGEADFVEHILGGILYAAGGTTDVDSDGDSIVDTQDNCRLTANTDQRDSNADGFGNLCDADFNDDCTTNFQDLAILSEAFLTTEQDVDINGDGAVNFLDVNLFGTLFLTEPGPSALATCSE